MTEEEYTQLLESARYLNALNVTEFLTMIFNKAEQWVGELNNG